MDFFGLFSSAQPPRRGIVADLVRLQGAPAAKLPDAQGQVPRVHLAPAAANARARLFDWNSLPPTGQIAIKPQRPNAWDAAMLAALPVKNIMADLRKSLLSESRDLSDDIEGWVSAIQAAKSAGSAELAAELQAQLFRANQYALIATLGVEESPRYQRRGDNTYCNIYAYDLLTPLGAYLPRIFWNSHTADLLKDGRRQALSESEAAERRQAGESLSGFVVASYGETVFEQGANALNEWFDDWGCAFGWRKADDMDEAQQAANRGRPAVISARGLPDDDGLSPGHITVVVAEWDGKTQAHRDGAGRVDVPLQSQAGQTNHALNTKYHDKADVAWWKSKHRNGNAWIYEGPIESPLMPPEHLGFEP